MVIENEETLKSKVLLEVVKNHIYKLKSLSSTKVPSSFQDLDLKIKQIKQQKGGLDESPRRMKENFETILGEVKMKKRIFENQPTKSISSMNLNCDPTIINKGKAM